MAEAEPLVGIGFKVSATFAMVSLAIAGLVLGATNMQLATIERAAILEAENFAKVVAYASTDNALNNPAWLQTYVDGLHASHGRDLVFADINKMVIADANKSEVGKVFDADSGNEVGQTMRDGRSRTFIEWNEQHAQGVKQIVVPVRVSRAVADSTIIGAAIVEYTQIYDVLLAAEQRNLYLLGVSGIGCVLLTMLFGLRMAVQIARRLKSLQHAADAVAQGNYETTVSVKSGDEIGRLGAAFNVMAKTLKGSRDELVDYGRRLEDRVASRTEDLSKANMELRVEADERAKAVIALSESERRFSDMLGNVELVSLMLDCKAQITYCNDYLLRLTGWQREEVLGRNWIEVFIPPGNNDEKDVITALLANSPAARHHENEILTRAGERQLIRWNNSVLRSGAGDVIGTASIGEDITARRKASDRIAYLNRVYAMLSGINTLIVRVRDRDELFREACRIAVEAGGFRMAWIGILDRSAMKIVPLAFAGGNEELLTAIKDRFSSTQHGTLANTVTARTIMQKRAVVSNDSQSDPTVVFGKKYAESGIQSVANFPLIVEDEVIGILALYAGEIEFFHAEEMELLTELAGDISFALEHIGKEKKIARLSRIQAVMSSIYSAIVHIGDRQELLSEACRIAVEIGGFGIAWIGKVDPVTQDITVTAWAGIDANLSSTRRSSRADVPEGQGLTGRAVREKTPVFDNDIAKRVGIGGGAREEAIRRGYRSVVALPLLAQGAVLGALALFATEADFFDAEELRLLTELAGNIAFAIEHIAKEEKLNYLAYYDVLTGLANRSLFLERVAQYMRSAVSGGHKLAVGLIDLERFKNINDSLGRPAGDALLRQVAEWLTQNLGDASLLARLDADHFAVVLPAVRPDGDLSRLVEKFMAAFLEHPFRLNAAVFRISVKVGVAVFPDDGADADTLFRNAEAALKKAKSGGDRYLFYAQKMTAAVASRLTLENQLRQALDEEEFVLHYQPKINLASGKLTGAEALIRWNDPRTGLAPPAQFIPILEETGLIYEVGRWALRKAIADYLRWRAAGLPAVRIAVNVSPLQLRNRGFVAEIEQVIGIDAQAAAGLELEITESLIMEDVQHNIASLQAIRAMGVTIAIDDFGTGFSSLSYLAKLPVDTLKIDRSFVIDMTAGPQGLALVSTIINLAHSMKLKVVAEGVETEEQSRLLRLLNCDEMQGYLFSKPVPAEIFETKFLTPGSAVTLMEVA
jgi:diguanylate cyclase (GGDEF)-like protein/PAS domain S-box-containing protein